MSALLGERDAPDRALCVRCLRPSSACWCGELAPIAAATHVVFLQHPRESRVAIGTCRMAHLALTGSELHRGVSFESMPRVRALVADAGGDVAVLYPGDDACEPATLAATPRTLIVLDGTWHQVRTMWRENPSLHRLPRIGFTPRAPGNYRIRREPAPHCLATVEAVVEILGRLEGDPDRFRPMLRAFDHMVETQLFYRRLKPGAPWRRTKRRRAPRTSVVRTALQTRRDDLVVVYAEANAHPVGVHARDPELVHLVACRPATGERLVALAAPRLPLAPSTPHHLELAAERLRAGDDVAAVMARWRRFTRPTDLVCSWGWYTLELLRREGADEPRDVIDIRDAVTRELNRRTDGVETAAALVGDGEIPAAWTDGRAGRRIAALAAIVARLGA